MNKHRNKFIKHTKMPTSNWCELLRFSSFPFSRRRFLSHMFDGMGMSEVMSKWMRKNRFETHVLIDCSIWGRQNEK